MNLEFERSPEQLVRRTNNFSKEFFERARDIFETNPSCEAKVDVQGKKEACGNPANFVVFWEDRFDMNDRRACGWNHTEEIEQMAVVSLVNDLGYQRMELPAFIVIEKTDVA